MKPDSHVLVDYAIELFEYDQMIFGAKRRLREKHFGIERKANASFQRKEGGGQNA